MKTVDRIAGCIGEIEEVTTTSDLYPLGIENLSKGSGCVCRQLVYEQLCGVLDTDQSIPSPPAGNPHTSQMLLPLPSFQLPPMTQVLVAIEK